MRLQLFCWFLFVFLLCLTPMCLVDLLYSSSLPQSVSSLMSSLLFSWLLKRMTRCLSFQASQSVAAKIHLPCRYFTQAVFSSLYYHPYDACTKPRNFSLVRLHSCINFIPIPSGQTISPLSCFWCPFLLHGTTKWAPHASHCHLWLSPLPSGDLCETLPLAPWALNCPNWPWYRLVADLELPWLSSVLV